jgi:hypothetical protein
MALGMTNGDPFQRSLMAQPAYRRLAGAAFFIAALWIAIFWAVSLP